MRLSDLPLDLDALEQLIRNASPEDVARLAEVAAPKLSQPWLPQPGPQSDAFYHEADELLYGGAAGGGKSDLLIGLATTAHRRSLIFRAQSKDLDGFWTRLREVVENPRSSNDVKRSMTTQDGRLIEGGHLGMPGSERDWQGRPHDLIAFDEAAQLVEGRVIFVLQWLRSTDLTQRKRVVFATNPPIPEIGPDGKMLDTGLGDWLVRWFAPWIDDHHPDPAEPGELRWCFMKAEGGRYETVWVDGPGYYDPNTGAPMPDATQADVDGGKVAVAKSRTFVRSLLKDNVFLRGTGYAERLASTPEPLKSMLLSGDFTVRGEDHPFQIIPTQWVLDAQKRWEQRSKDDVMKLRQLVLYADIAQGGAHSTVIAPLCETAYFDELVTQPGSKTPTGKEVAMLLLSERLDNSFLVADGTGGWAGATQATLQQLHNIELELHIASESDGSWTPDMRWHYKNNRSKMWWEFRLALDPKSGHNICLPPSTRLRVQLTTPHWYLRGTDLHVEGKDEIAKRIGGSTDEADAVMGAWQYYEYALARAVRPEDSLIAKLNRRPAAEDYPGAPYDLANPLGDW